MHKSPSKDNLEIKRPWSFRKGTVNGMINGRPRAQKPLQIPAGISISWNQSQMNTMWTVTHFQNLENIAKILEFCYPSLQVLKCDWHYLRPHGNVLLSSLPLNHQSDTSEASYVWHPIDSPPNVVNVDVCPGY